MTLSFIYARSENHCIGKGGKIPWRLPDEFAHFKRTTLGKPIIMGRRTYEDHQSALPGRLNLVVTRKADYSVAEGVKLTGSVEAALALAAVESDEAFIVGGVGLFVDNFSRVDRVYETIVHTHVDGGDTFVPDFDFGGFDTTELFHHEADRRHAFAFTAYLHARGK
jgi:dihydrofolate reductase